MCGIAGVFEFARERTIHPPMIHTMGRLLRHRGPDGEGVYIEEFVGLAHQRLAIIDVAGGAQPMSNEDGTLWLTLNGEVYNHRQLRAQLEAKGHVFATECDAEVVLHLYEEHGVDCVEYLNGQFAFALWDGSKR